VHEKLRERSIFTINGQLVLLTEKNIDESMKVLFLNKMLLM